MVRSRDNYRGFNALLIAAGLCLALFLISSFASNAQDTVRLLVNGALRYEIVLPPDTVVKRDTIYLSQPCPAVKDTIFRGLYVSDLGGKLGTSRSAEVLQYAKQEGFNYLDVYGLGSVIGSSSKEAQLAAWIRSASAQGVRVGATGGSGTSWADRARYNRSRYSPKERFSGFNLEYEYWRADSNQASLLATWAKDSAYLVQMDTTGKNLELDGWTQYVGWYPSPLQARAPALLQARTTYHLIHYYRSKPEAAYGKHRLDSIEALGARLKKQQIVRPIFSAEPAPFMQTWFRTASPDSAWKSWLAQLRTFNYKWIVSDGYQVFHDDFLRVARPLRAVNAAARSANNEIPLPPTFINEPTNSHLRLKDE